MFANFTEETCTGTGDTLELAGVTTGNIAFSKSFADGDPVAYSLKDSGGTIKVEGVGTYVAATDDITRKDTWNWNGTIIDENPSTNIPLSGGTHEVSCAMSAGAIQSISQNSKSLGDNWKYNGILGTSYGASTTTLTADTQYATVFRLMESSYITSVRVWCNTQDAVSTTRIGVTKCIGGVPDTSYIASGVLDTVLTGEKTVPVGELMPAGWYFIHIVTTSSTVRFYGTGAQAGPGNVAWSPCVKTPNNGRDSPTVILQKTGVTLGVLDVAPETVSSAAVVNDQLIGYVLL